MSWKVNQKEFNALIVLEPPKRYAYFIKKAIDFEEIWSLKNRDGWVLMGDDEGHQIIPVWPHSRYASACAVEEWADTKAELISLDDWMQKWLPGIEKDERLIAIFPVPSNKGIVVSPKRLKTDLEAELSLYE